VQGGVICGVGRNRKNKAGHGNQLAYHFTPDRRFFIDGITVQDSILSSDIEIHPFLSISPVNFVLFTLGRFIEESGNTNAERPQGRPLRTSPGQANPLSLAVG
jgi:hypothetical protein